MFISDEESTSEEVEEPNYESSPSSNGSEVCDEPPQILLNNPHDSSDPNVNFEISTSPNQPIRQSDRIKNRGPQVDSMNNSDIQACYDRVWEGNTDDERTESVALADDAFERGKIILNGRNGGIEFNCCNCTWIEDDKITCRIRKKMIAGFISKLTRHCVYICQQNVKKIALSDSKI